MKKEGFRTNTISRGGRGEVGDVAGNLGSGYWKREKSEFHSIEMMFLPFKVNFVFSQGPDSNSCCCFVSATKK